MSRPLVTIGLSTFNAAETLARALASALAQTWRPIEVVVVDDASTDGTGDMLQGLAAAHPEVRVFFQPRNGGVAVSRNRILSEARGEFVAFFDDDDESDPERVAAQVKRLTDYERDFAASALVICHTARRRVYAEGLTRVEGTMGQRLAQRAPHGPAVARRILLGTPLEDAYGACATCSQLARLSTYKRVGGFDASLRRGEDTDLSIRLAEAGGHFVGLSQPLVTQWMTRTSEKSLVEEHRNLLLLMEKHRPIMDRAGQFQFCRQWMEVKQCWLEGRRGPFLWRLVTVALRHPILTARRLAAALPNLGLNRAFSRFHGAR